jgi:exosortase
MTIHRHALFSGFVLAVLAVNGRVLADVVDLAMHDSTASHLILIPFVTIALIFQRRHAVFAEARTLGGFKIAAVVLATIAVWALCWFWVAARPSDALSTEMAAIVWTCVAAFVIVYGTRAARAASFPLAFLVFAVPLPSTVLAAATAALKRGSADCVAALFTVTRTPFHRDGFIFELPSFAIEIADECSGIRSSIALFLTALLAGDALLTRGWTKALLALAVFPFAILKNGIRIVALTLLSIHVDSGFLTGQLHHDGGVVFFVIVVLMMAPLVGLLAKWDHAGLNVGQP